MKKTLAILLSVIFIICMLPINALAATVTKVDVEDITLPIAGKKPDLSAGLGNDSGAYKITLVEWSEYDAGWEWQKDMTANDTFKEGYWYVVFVHLETTSGNTFDNNVSCYINDAKANISGNSVQANGTKVTCYTSYQATKVQTAISKVDLTVVKPVVGKTPTFAKVDTTQFVSEKYGTVSNCSNGVTWTNQSSGINLTVNNPFKEGVKYRVTYYLTAKDGYKFTSGTKCTINGSTAALELKDSTHAAISLSNLVPGDGKKEISSLELNVTAPKDGEKPSYTKIDGNGYYSDNGLNGTSTKIYKNGIAWYKSASSYISPGTTETFKSGTAYTVKISLLAKDGYKFGKTVTAKINGKTASVETFDDGSINVSLKLTASSKDHTHTAGSTWQFDDMEHWKICSYKDCGTLVGKKQMHSNSDPDGKCDICGYQLPIEVPEGTTASGTNTVSSKNSSDETSDPNESTIGSSDVTSKQDKDKNNENKQDNEKNGPRIWILLLILPVAALVLAAGGIVLVILLKKKK